MRVFLLAAFMLSASSAASHEMTPAYPKLEQSYLDGLSMVSVNLFNRRSDVTYYEIEVFDDKWNPVPFASENKIIKLRYLSKKNISVFIRNKDSGRATYICTESKLLKNNETTARVNSRICSKIKRDE